MLSRNDMSLTFDEWPLILNFLTAYNNGGATLTRLMPGQALALQGFPGIVYISGGAIHSFLKYQK